MPAVKSRFQLILIVSLLGAICFGASTAQSSVITIGCADVGRSCSLDELAGGGSIIVDDKRFDDWFVEDFSTLTVALDTIDVSGLDDQPDNLGLQFDTNGAFSVTGLDVVDVLLGFSVSTLDGSARINKSSLEIDSAAFGANNVGGLIQIAEDVSDATGIPLGSEFVQADNFPPVLLDLFDSTAFSPQSQIFVEKSIFLVGDEFEDTVSLDTFTQRFSQVPEPLVLSLVGIGLVGLRLFGKRRI